jgi:hypothetical protein
MSGAGPAAERALAQTPWSARGEFTDLLDAVAETLGDAARGAVGAEVSGQVPKSIAGRNPAGLLEAQAMVAGILLAAGGWALLIFGALQNLETGLPRLLAFTAVGSAHLILGACVVYRSLRDVGEEPR